MTSWRWLVPSTVSILVVACNRAMDAPASEPPSAEAGVEPDRPPPAPWQLDARAYDASCTTNWDCRLYPTGPCRECMCRDTALNVGDGVRYEADFEAEIARTRCQPLASPDQERCQTECRSDGIALCIDRQCVPGTERKQDMSGYSRACTTVDDCVGVSSWLCFGGVDCTDAIARSALPQFEADRLAQPACGTPGPYGGNACPDVLRCVSGTCTFERPPVP